MTMNFAKQLRVIRTSISVIPIIYLPLARNRKGDTLVSRDTDIVIEGYPRSGNSFAEAAFRLAQHKPVKIAHHCHAAAQILAAAKWHIPTLVVIRDPTEAGRSLMMHHPDLFTARDALREYCVFHEAIEPVRSSYVLAAFEAVTGDFGAVIDAVNSKFGTSFDRFEHNPENERAAFALLDKLSRERGTVDNDGEPYSPRRSDAEKEARERAKELARASMLAPEVDDIRGRAEYVFQRMMASRDL